MHRMENIKSQKISPLYKMTENLPHAILCVEVLQPSQPNRVMSSAVSLPNYTFTGQA